MRFLLLLLVVVLVNLPAAHEVWTDHRIDRDGRDVTATVVDARRAGDRNLVDYRLPKQVAPTSTVYSATLDDDAYAAAVATDELEVRVVPGDPGANRPAGEAGNPLFWSAALGADAILVVVALLTWQRRRRRAENGPDLYDL